MSTNPSEDRKPGLRDRARRAMQAEIAHVAASLFIEHGYEATTIEDIAAAAGISPRSVFRYFPTKEELVVSKFDLTAEAMLAELALRPAGEPIWTTLRHLFTVLETEVDAPEKRRTAVQIHKVIFESPMLLAAYLQKLHDAQFKIVIGLRRRAEANGSPFALDDPTPQALTGAAFGCLVAAQHSWLVGGAIGSYAQSIDRAMATIRPVDRR